MTHNYWVKAAHTSAVALMRRGLSLAPRLPRWQPHDDAYYCKGIVLRRLDKAAESGKPPSR